MKEDKTEQTQIMGTKNYGDKNNWENSWCEIFEAILD